MRKYVNHGNLTYVFPSIDPISRSVIYNYRIFITEGIPASQVPLRGRGRPSRFNMFDLQEMVNSSNGLANGMNGLHQGMDMDMSMDMKLSPSSLTGSSPPTLQHPAMSIAQAAAMAVSSSMVGPTASLASSAQASAMASAPADQDQEEDDMPPTPQSATQEQQAQQAQQQQAQQAQQQQAQQAQHHHQAQSQHDQDVRSVVEKHAPRMNNGNGVIDMSEADDHSLSLAVEMAAVNQAIIALSGQTPVPPMQAVKPEREG